MSEATALPADLADRAPAGKAIDLLVGVFGRKIAHRTLDLVLDKLPITDLAGLAYDWEFWARPKQIPPATYRTCGFLTARGFGKTRACAEHVNRRVISGELYSIGLCAQNEDKSVEVHIHGPTGLIETAPPWFKPHFEATAKQLVWPNGARAFVRTPEVPGTIRSGEHDLSWLSEIQSWPVATRDEAYSNFLFATRSGPAQILWDATPKKRHPILLAFLAKAKAEPGKHFVVRGTVHENAANLGEGVIEDWTTEWGGTQRGREELLGEMLDDADGALVKQAWIDGHRRALPERFARKAVGVDPAVTTRAGSDLTGIDLAGLGVDGQLYVLKDATGKHDAPTWAKIVLDLHEGEGCDLVVVETNKGGNLLVQNLRASASTRTPPLTIEIVSDKWQPHRKPGTVFVREIHSRGPKEDRAQPLATAYERGRVSHVRGAELGALEDILTTWEPMPGQRSPDGLDALVHVAGELLGLTLNKPDRRQGFTGIQALREAASAATRGPSASTNLAAMLRRETSRGGGRL